jgi:hypothetical protein
MSREELISQAPFSYRVTKSGLAQIFYEGRVVMTLSGRAASQFIAKITGLESDGEQLAMAKITGHFKQGTEHISKPTTKAK